MDGRAVGIVGVGLMGSGIAHNVMQAGWTLHFLDHPGNQPTQSLLEGGATPHRNAAALAAATDIVIICVTGTPQVEDVLTRQDGVLLGLKAGSIVIDCSTAIPSSTVRLARMVEAKGAHFLDSPMTRTPKEAMEGRLNVIVGGDRAVFEDALPLLRSFAEGIHFAGQTGAGHTLKLLHNYVSLGFSAILAEAAAVSAESGIDMAVFHKVLHKGGGRGVVLDRFAPYLLVDDISGFRFTLDNAAKDIGYFVQMLSEGGQAGHVARAVEALYSSSVTEGHGREYVPTLVSVLRSASG